MSDRSIRAAADLLASLPSEAGSAADALAGDLKALTDGVTAPLRAVRSERLRGLSDQIEMLGLAMISVVRGAAR